MVDSSWQTVLTTVDALLTVQNVAKCFKTHNILILLTINIRPKAAKNILKKGLSEDNPFFIGAPCTTRTCDLRLTQLYRVLY